MKKVYDKTDIELLGMGGSNLPPCADMLLAWAKGNSSDTLLLDSAPALGDFPMVMSDGPCLTANGVGDTFTTVVNHGTIVSYEGTATLAYDGSTLTSDAGTFYNLLFSDGTLYPCIGKTDLVNPTSIFATNGSELVIVSSDYVAAWGGTQDTYFYEVSEGFWEDVGGRYPYAHVGATKVDAGWNHPQNKFAFKERSVGTFDGVGDNVKLLTPRSLVGNFNISGSFIHKSDGVSKALFGGQNVTEGLFRVNFTGYMRIYINGISYQSSVALVDGVRYVASVTRVNDVLTISVNGVDKVWSGCDTSPFVIRYIGVYASTVNFMVGILFDTRINDTLISLNEGQGTDIKDSLGNPVGTLISSDVPAFWNDAILEQELTDADASYLYLSDASYHGVPKTQTEIETDGVVNVNNQYWFTPLRGLTIYNDAQVQPCISKINDYHGLS